MIKDWVVFEMRIANNYRFIGRDMSKETEHALFLLKKLWQSCVGLRKNWKVNQLGVNEHPLVLLVANGQSVVLGRERARCVSPAICYIEAQRSELCIVELINLI